MKLKEVAANLHVGVQLLKDLLSGGSYNPNKITDEQYDMLAEKVREMVVPLTGEITERPEDYMDEILKFLEYGLHKEQIPEIITDSVHRFIKEIGGQSLARNTVSSWSDEMLINIEKMFMLDILFNEKDRHRTLLALCDIMVLSGRTTSNEYLAGLVSIAKNCIMGMPIRNLGFSKDNIVDKLFSHSLCQILIQRTTFEKPQQGGPILLYEGKGMVAVEDGNIFLSPANYKRSRKLNVAYSLLDGIQVKNANSRVYDSTDYDEVDEFLKYYRQMQRAMTPSYLINTTMKNYHEGDRLCVRVTEANYSVITAESVDVAYHRISEPVDVNGMNFYYREGIKKAIISAFKSGKAVYLTVTRTGTGFGLKESLEEFIEERVATISGPQDSLCIDMFKNRKGLRWLTSDGLIVNVPDEDCAKEDIGKYYAIEGISVGKDISGSLCLNGDYADDDYIEEGPDWFYHESWQVAKTETLALFGADFVGSMKEPKQQTSVVALPQEYLKPLVHLFYCYSQTIQSSCERLKMLGTARLLAIAISSNEDISFLKFEQNYLARLVAFARGESDKRKLKMELPDDMQDVTLLKKRVEVCEQLAQYDIEEPLQGRKELPPFQNLVDASNTLSGVLGLGQLDIIKRKITESLHVADEYRTIVPKTDKEEGKDIEYKTSIIYSPLNMKTPEYDKQMGRILKTICAFLNSENGGTLVIGETDDHGVNGFMEDIRKLKADKRIKTLNKDDYWLYLKGYIDTAFKEESSFAAGKEITATRIEKSYVMKEGKEVMTISVQPYIYDIIEFAINLDGLKGTAWYRSDANTLEMTPEMRHQVLRKKKLKWDNSIEKIRQILVAKKKQLAVVFKDYPSKTRMKDRNVEAYCVFQDIDAVICYDLDDKRNKEYKISRIGRVEVTDQPWRCQMKHRTEPKVDIFKFLEPEKGEPYHIVLRLTPYAKTLLVEEFPRSRSLLDPSRRGTKNRLTESEDKLYWTLETDVYRLESVGRFCLGLLNQVSIEECDALKAYVKGEIEKYLGS